MYHGNRPSLVMYLSVRRISGRVKYLYTWPECQDTWQSDLHFCLRFNVPVNNLSDMSVRIPQYSGKLTCLAQGHKVPPEGKELRTSRYGV